MKKTKILSFVILAIIVGILIIILLGNPYFRYQIHSLNSSYYTNSSNFAQSTKDNPFGIDAVVAYSYDLPISCPKSPCGPLNAFTFGYVSSTPIELLGYNICDGAYCITSEGFVDYSPPRPELIGHLEQYGYGTLGDVPWNIGDIVHIRVKAQPVTINETGDLVPHPDKMQYIDLGTSKIMEVRRR